MDYVPSFIAVLILALSICICCRRAYRRTPGRIFRSDVVVTHIIHQPLPTGQTGIVLPNQAIVPPYPISNPITFPPGPLTHPVHSSMLAPTSAEPNRPTDELPPPSYEAAISSAGAVEYKRQNATNPNY